MRFPCVRLLIAVALSFSLAGCSRQALDVKRSEPLTQAQWLSKLQERVDYWKNYQAKLSVKAESSQKKFRVQTVVLGKVPNQFRLEAFKLGQTVGVLVMDQGKSSLWVPSEKTFFSTSRPERLIEYFLGVPVPLETFSYSLIACLPSEQLEHLDVIPISDGWIARSEDKSKGAFYTWKFASQPLSLRGIDVRQGPLIYSITYDPPVDLDPRNVPMKINFASATWQMEVVVDQMTVSGDFQSFAFALPSVSDAKRINLDISK